MKIVAAEFVRSAVGVADYPRGRAPQIAFVGRSNVGKSTLINALVRRKVARTSAAPGKTRLANIYRVDLGSRTLYFVDLPGYGYARGGAAAARSFEALARGYFAEAERTAVSALLALDARHPGLDRDIAAFEWLRAAGLPVAAVATKIDRLSRAAQQQARREMEETLRYPVLPVSAATGEGLDDLWQLIISMADNSARARSTTR